MKKVNLNIISKTNVVLCIAVVALGLFLTFNPFSGKELTAEECRDKFAHFLESRDGEVIYLSDKDNSGSGQIIYSDNSMYTPSIDCTYKHFPTEEEAMKNFDSLYSTAKNEGIFTVSNYYAGDEAFIKEWVILDDYGNESTYYSVHFRHGRNLFNCAYSSYDRMAYVKEFIMVMTNDF